MAEIEAGRARFLAELSVSRETITRLDAYAALLRKWNAAINLVSSSSLQDIWDRHFRDSAQIFALSRWKSGLWVDLGAGAGFPGMICAILAKERAPDLRFTLVESDLRKATFLRAVSRETNVPVTVLSARIEDIAPLGADVISARALAPLKTLLEYAYRHMGPDGQALFHKGSSFRREVEEALESWTFRRDEYPSSTDGAGVVLSLGDIRRV
ncbi:MAG: 16S rRNA (guanine(527)-N(7))-methyltransferase RsmG [Paracoccaceae bacterium]